MSHLFDTTGYRRWAGGVKTSTTTAPSAVSTTIPDDMILTEGMRGIRVMVFGDTADDSCTLQLWAVERNHVQGTGGPKNPREIVYISRLFVDVTTLLIGALAGVASSPLLVGPSELFGETYTLVTVAPYGQRVLANANGSADAYSNTGDLAGELFVSDLGNAYGIVPKFPTMTTGNYFGVIYRLDT